MTKSGKIALRAVEPTDADFMFDVENDPEAWRYGDTIAPISRRIIRDYAVGYDANPFTSGQLRLVVTDKDSGAPAGLVDLYDISCTHRRAFVGIYICRQYRRKGFANDAIHAICNYAKEILMLRKLSAKIEDSNTKSISLFEKSGFSKEASLKDWFLHPDGTTSNLLLYTSNQL